MNRESICSQQIHCLSCPISTRITGKPCDKLTESEIKMIVKYPENICTICGSHIPDGVSKCPECKATEADMFENAAEYPEIKDEVEQAFRQGYQLGISKAQATMDELRRELDALRNERMK